MALSASYSMAFDEYLHLGIIKLYAHQWLPFFSAQPPGADAFGAVARDPSYLYHYLMSFPYRLFAHFVHGFIPQVIFLRLFSIGFFAGGLLILRATFRRLGGSPLLSNLALGFFLLLPVVPFMAAQINYDNLLFLLTAVSIYLSVQILQAKSHLLLLPLLWLLAVMLLASQVKYAYLPILVALVGFLGVYFWRTLGWPGFWRQFKHELSRVRRWQLVLASLVVLVSLGLFADRYGVDLVQYHTPTPECNRVLSLQHCMAYEPFARNYTYHVGHYNLPTYQIAAYPFNNWARGMLRSLFFVVSSKESGYQAGEPLPLAHAAGYIVLVGGLVLILVRLKWLWNRSVINRLFAVIVVVYSGLLFAQNFTDFLHTHVPVAIQGRYLVQILPLYLWLVLQAALDMVRRWPRALALGLLALLCFMMIEGGSFVPFVVRQHDDWLWQVPLVQRANHVARDAVRPLIIGAWDN